MGGGGTSSRQPPVVYDPSGRPPLTLPQHTEADPITENLDNLYGEADKFMLSITSRTGGRVYDAETFENTRAAFAAIADELHNLYMLGYYPTVNRRDGKLHKIKVEVARKEVRVRARSGYQMPKSDTRK
jgi:VWFA-related protein